MTDDLNFRTIGRAAKGNARSSGYDRSADDWYVESPQAVDALLAAEPFTGLVWDPACGGGNILRQCGAHGINCVGSDLVLRGLNLRQMDFLKIEPSKVPVGLGGGRGGHPKHILTNPPFKLAQQFVEQALATVPGKVCVLQRLAWLEGQKRREFFQATGLSHVWVHSSRVSMPPGGSTQKATGGAVAFAWFVWARTPIGRTPTLGWLP